MVSGARQVTQNEPPPLDEGWWRSVLAEDPIWVEKPSRGTEKSRFALPSASGTPAAQESVNWELAEALFRADQVIEMRVTGYNKGGLLVNGAQLQGFVPVSHLVDMPNNLTPREQEQCLAAYQGHTLRLKIIECDPQRGRVVLSERAALADSGRRNLLFSQLKAGECVQGTVTNITDFGVFVDLGGVEGLIHVSELSWGRVRHPRDVVKLGERVYAYVLQVDPERCRIALSLKRLCDNPWETAEERYRPGQITEAVITGIVPFGAFARLEEGIDGLIHITEFGDHQEGHEQLQSLREGDRVQVRILHVDASRQRLGLSLRLKP
ncbi:MAG: S1 RNA-binding domain-containing protein [Anaerolineales bacterium]|nr:S1 RNA-binding domain-containing protein [Anaerolineales bacterium]MCS7247438.1 S1 RNA-binding domain-containing protein [Anaerolineales bacterium]MDW8161249.1 S1 RNA-binding domain-containing protein [Anaerolineales bacterium]MDW8445985.1 S1 RNA-binding domain-containing protein [Anaerolineales bacterium]